MRRPLVVLGALSVLLLVGAVAASAQTAEVIRSYLVEIQIESGGDLLITETIDYDFGSNQRHGIIHVIPTRFRYDDTSDRIYPLDVGSVTATDAPDDVDVSEEGGDTSIRIGDPDETVSGRHTYTIEYRVEGGLNGFPEHDELYWNAIGTEWEVPIERAQVIVRAPADISRVDCFQGYQDSTEACDGAAVGAEAGFEPARPLGAFEGMTVVVALPKGAVPDPQPVLEERWAVDRAFALTPVTGGLGVALLAAVIGGFAALAWRTGRDRRYVGSPIDQVMGNPTGEDRAVSPFDLDASAPVEFAPPEGLRPGQIGTLLDEQANTLDVSASIVDLAVRGYLVIEEIPKEGWFGKADWRLIRQDKPAEELLGYERKLLDGLFQDEGSDVKLSELKSVFAARLKEVRDSLYADVVERGWFLTNPDLSRQSWARRGLIGLVAGAALTYVLARWTHLGLLGLPVVVGGLLLMVGAKRMPARTAKGTAMLRRVRGFRTVIEKAETHISRWAEQENVFTRYLPYAIVFGVTEKWAKAFEPLGLQPDTSWYVSPYPFVYHDFARTMDGFAVTSGGTISSTPSGSGSSGFGGGGFSGGGGGGGGGGSW